MSRSTDRIHRDAPVAAPRPEDLVLRWPVDRPLLALRSGRAGTDPRARWSVLTTPSSERRWDARTIGDPLETIRNALAGRTRAPDARRFAGGWILVAAYELGRHLEPAARATSARGRAVSGWPLLTLARCDWALVHDGLEDRWSLESAGDATVPAWAAGLLEAARDAATPSRPPVELGPVTGTRSETEHRAAVERARALIARGDVFQVNLVHHLRARIDGSTRALAAHAFEAAGPWYGASLELGEGRTILSMSPELLVDLDPGTREAVTRPIKGTRPAGTPPDELLRSEKDAAELTMIVDLMRNDLGRISRLGSVTVPVPRAIETHPTVLHGVGEVRGVLRDDVDVAALLAAVHPAGSITGAPKIRAMQVIEALEDRERGPAFGSLGWIGDDGRVVLSVAIRTAAITGDRPPGRFDRLGGVLDYAVGGGIVADSDPRAEWQESLDKAAVLRLLAERVEDAAAPALG